MIRHAPTLTSNNRPAAFLGITAVAAMWGLSFVSTKVLLRTLSPVQVAFSRHVLAAVATIAVALLTRQPLAVRRADIPAMLAAAVAGIPVYFYFENTSLLYVSAATASMITAANPAITATFESLFRRKRLPLRSWMGILVSAAGVALVVRIGAVQAAQAARVAEAAGGAASTHTFIKGAMMLLLSATAWSVYTIVNKPLMERYSVITANAYQVTAATVVLGLIAALQGGAPPVLDALAKPEVVTNLAYLGILCSAAAYALYLFALRTLGSTTATSFLNLIPVFGVLGSALILGETVSAIQLLGGAVVVGGIFLVDSGQRKTR